MGNFVREGADNVINTADGFISDTGRFVNDLFEAGTREQVKI